MKAVTSLAPSAQLYVLDVRFEAGRKKPPVALGTKLLF